MSGRLHETAPAWTGFRPLRVAEIRPESSTITSFRLVPADDAPVAQAAPGQYLTVRLQPDPDAPALIRSYSLSDVAGESGYRISVKREGAASRHLHAHAAVGDAIEAAAPRGTFTLRAGTRPVVLISAGVGATPVLAMLHALAHEPSTRPVWWLHRARNHGEHAFGPEVDALIAALAHAQRVVAFSRPGGAAVSGRLDLTVLDVPLDADFYVCGPDGFMRDVGAALTARGVAPERVRTEAFGTVPAHASGLVRAGERPPHAPDGPPGAGPAITFARSHLTIPWDDRYASLLDLAEAWDVPVGFGCRNGVWDNCESNLLAGTIGYDPDPLEAPPAGRILVCCSRPTSELTLDL